jgi:protease-4
MSEGGERGEVGESTLRAAAGKPSSGWEREVLERLVMATVEERRRARRWGIFFKFTGLSLVVAAFLLGSGLWVPAERKVAGLMHTALIDLNGVIGAEGEVTADSVGEALRAAFEDANTAGVVLRINSPGGSPVQAGIIHDEIRRLRAAHPKTPVYAVVEEICASGGYYVAAAADRIFVDKASVVGSIGVLMEGFGFVDAMKKLGIERRLLTSGRNKGYLDMFTPVSPEHKAHQERLLGEVHRQFIGVVQAGRGDRLKNHPDLFSGLVWTGERSVELGLADGLGSLRSVAREEVKAEEVVDFTRRQNLAERLAKRVGAGAGAALANALSVGAEPARLR